jgi:hypothetical protein
VAKTYNSIPSVATGDVYTATAHNNIVTNVNNYRVPPACIVPLLTSQNITDLNNTAFGFGTASVNTDMTITAGTTSTTIANGGKIQVTTAGVYLVSYSVTIASNATNVRQATIRVNSTGTPDPASGFLWKQVPGTSSGTHLLTNSGLISLAANDEVQFLVRQNSTVTLSFAAVGGASANFVSLAWLGQVS